ncbi:universal stress protein [Streptomyces sp. NPDC048639]|uniref:universal stress protein n=1 Tax=Streptomyces sp. NPDC048639 TaxID=3365581 RepID=UPI0037122FDE
MWDGTIAVGVDGSLESLAAADWAAQEAQLRGTSLRLVQAWEWKVHPGALVPSNDTQRDWATRLLHEAEERIKGLHPELSVTTELVSGTPVAALLAASADAALLVLGSRGLGGVVGFLLGSTGLETLAEATRPVVLVRPGEQGQSEPERSPLSGREVVLGLDMQQPCDDVIAFAFEAADRRQVPLRVVHAWDIAPVHRYAAGRPGHDTEPRQEDEVRQALTEILRPWRSKFPDTEVVEDAFSGRAGRHLVEAAARAGLVVMGRRMQNPGHGTHLGPVAHAVIHHARCPVAAVPHK